MLQLFFVLRSIAVIALLILTRSADIYSAEFGHQLVRELNEQNQQQPSVQLALQSYGKDPEDPHHNYLLGVISVVRHQDAEAMAYFRKAAELSGFENDLYLTNYVSLGARHNSTAVLEYLVGLAVYSKMNLIIAGHFDTLLSKYSASGDVPQQLLVRSPPVLPLWELYVVNTIRSYHISRSSILEAHERGHAERNITVYGLLLFPRSGPLLLVRALQSYHSGNITCANYFYHQAQTHRVPALDTYLSDHYHWLSTRLLNTDRQSVSGQCTDCEPCTTQHTVESYQRLYQTLRSVAGASLGRLTDVADVTQRTTNAVAPSSISTMDSKNRDVSTGTQYLPSLQIGCAMVHRCALPGFLIADAIDTASTHFLTQTYDLSMVGDASVGLVYSSHTLEHLSHTMSPPSCPSHPRPDPQVRGCESEIGASLSEWRRVLVPGGRLLVAVPDAEQLYRYFLHPETNYDEKVRLQTFIFGGQAGPYDFHKMGFFEDHLRILLRSHGFCNFSRVEKFRIFEDASSFEYAPGKPMSLNVIATAC